MFVPGLVVLGVEDRIPASARRARVFRFDNDGTLTDLGSGATALAALANDYITGQRWADSERALLDARELGLDVPEAGFALALVRSRQGARAGAREEWRRLVARWPEHPLALAARDSLRSGGE